MSAAGQPQSANSAPWGAAQRREPQAWGDHTNAPATLTAVRPDPGADAAYDVPYTTVHTGVIHSGTALNIVPRDCHFDFELRHLPFDDPDELFAEVQAYAQRFLPEMRSVAADATIEFDQLARCEAFMRRLADRVCVA